MEDSVPGRSPRAPTMRPFASRRPQRRKKIQRIAASHYATALNRGKGAEELRKVSTRKSILEGSCSRRMGGLGLDMMV